MAEETMEEEISRKFENYEDKIKAWIIKHIKYAWIGEEVSLIPGVCMLPINPEVSKNIYLWNSLPTVAVVWNQSWRVYFFALKTLLPEVFEERWKTQK